MELTLKTKYLNLATKKNICEEIKELSVKYENGMAYIDYITMQLITNLHLLQFYYGIDPSTIDMDELYENGTIQRAKDGIPESELEFIENNSWHLIKQEVDIYNSLSGMLNRNIRALIDKVPDEDELHKILNKMPKALEKIDPKTLELVKGIMDKKL